MTSRSIFVAAVLLLSLACRKEEPAAPAAQPATVTTPVAETTDLKGRKIDTTVKIPPVPVSRCDVKETFAANEPIDFTMHLAEAPEKLHVSVRVHQGDEEIAFVRQPAEGKKVATLRIPKLEPGKYRLEGLWGGNRACEKEIEVRE